MNSTTLSPIYLSLAVLGLAAAAVFSGTARADHPTVSSNLGTAVHGPSADREIKIGPETRWVNVTRNETVRFVVTGGKSFAWRFDTLGTAGFDLGQVAPVGVLENQRVRVYLAPDPNEVGG